jgi:hypothetical protein
MTFRGLIIHGALAVLSCVVAYSAWRHAQQGDEAVGDDAEAEVVALNLARSDLVQVAYLSKERNVQLDLAPQGQPLWVSVTSKTRILSPKNRPTPPPAPTTVDGSPAAADGGVVSQTADTGTAAAGDGDSGAAAGDAGPAASDVAAPPEPEYREKTERFVANEAADELLKTLAPFRVIRRLGALDDGQRAEFGLHESESSLRLTLREGTKEFAIGARTFGGGNHYYILDEEGQGFLLGSKVVQELKGAQSRLKQRDLQRFEMGDVASVKLSAPAGQRVLEHRHRQSPRDETWVDQDAPPEAKNQGNTNWMGQLKRLRVIEYPSPEAVRTFAPSGNPALRVEYFDGRGEGLGWAEIASRTVGDGDSQQFVARSEATGMWVRVSRSVTEQLLSDLDDILSGTSLSEP